MSNDELEAIITMVNGLADGGFKAFVVYIAYIAFELLLHWTFFFTALYVVWIGLKGAWKFELDKIDHKKI